MKVYVQGGGEINLAKNDFVAQGGEGSIYAKGGTAYKVYLDPKKMIPRGKMDELATITDPHVIKPEKVITDPSGSPIGLVYRFIQDAVALCKLFTRAFRDRENISPDMMLALVRQMQATVEEVHKARVLIVDLNEMNFLVGQKFNEVFFIDVDSWQTPHYRATALMESVRDRHMKPNEFTTMTDWFAFAIVTFQMLVGIHPYKGKHPTVKEMDDRMKLNLSVLNKDVSVPKVCYPFSSVPPALLDWYTRVFEKGERLPPPKDLQKMVQAAIPLARQIITTAKLDIQEMHTYDGTIINVWESAGEMVVVTDKTMHSHGTMLAPPGVKAAGFSLRTNKGVIAILSAPRTIPTLYSTTFPLGGRLSQNQIPFGLNADQVMSTGGRIYIKSGDKVLELILNEVASGVMVSTKVAADVLEQATKLYEGVVVQDLLGEAFLSVFPRTGTTYQFKVPELKGYRIVGAKYDERVLMVTGVKGGKYDRFVFRFDEDFTSYDTRKVLDVGPAAINFVTLDHGICACLNEEEKLELFSNKKGDPKLKIVEDPILGGDMILFKLGGRVAFARGDKLYRLSMK